jgi:hypothetical protein
MTTRRSFIRIVGGGVVVAAGATQLAGCASSYPSQAVQAWQPIATNTDIRRWMLAHALLAPNPHNRQPWKADLSKADEITLICDGDRLLPETDPFGRQILIGCGAFLELAVIAAAQRGYRVTLEAFPQGEPALNKLPTNAVIAKLLLRQDASVTQDPLFAFISKRHTNKGAYDNAKIVPADQWQALKTAGTTNTVLAGFVIEQDSIQKIKTITRQANETELTTARTYLESAKLLRIGPDEINQHRDGISINSPMLRALSSLGVINRLEVPVQGSATYKQIMERWKPSETGSGYFWLATNGSTRKQQLESGRAYVRTQLMATSLGLSIHPLSQALQEFAEVKSDYAAIHQTLGFNPAQTTLQMLVRVGYPVTPAEGTPRREIASMIV